MGRNWDAKRYVLHPGYNEEGVHYSYPQLIRSLKLKPDKCINYDDMRGDSLQGKKHMFPPSGK